MSRAFTARFPLPAGHRWISPSFSASVATGGGAMRCSVAAEARKLCMDFLFCGQALVVREANAKSARVGRETNTRRRRRDVLESCDLVQRGRTTPTPADRPWQELVRLATSYIQTSRDARTFFVVIEMQGLPRRRRAIFPPAGRHALSLTQVCATMTPLRASGSRLADIGAWNSRTMSTTYWASSV